MLCPAHMSYKGFPAGAGHAASPAQSSYLGEGLDIGALTPGSHAPHYFDGSHAHHNSQSSNIHDMLLRNMKDPQKVPAFPWRSTWKRSGRYLCCSISRALSLLYAAEAWCLCQALSVFLLFRDTFIVPLDIVPPKCDIAINAGQMRGRALAHMSLQLGLQGKIRSQ